MEAKSVDTTQTLEMDGSQITYGNNSLTSYLASLVTKNLLNYKEADKDCADFEMHLEKFVLYQPGVSFKSRTTPDRKEPSNLNSVFFCYSAVYYYTIFIRVNCQSNLSDTCGRRAQGRAAERLLG